MFGSRKSHNPDNPQGGKHDPPPNPWDRYVPADAIRLDLVDMNGDPVVVLLSRRAARALAYDLFGELSVPTKQGGVG